MTINEIKAMMNIAAAIAALIAAGLWYRASAAIVRPADDKDAARWKSAQVTIDHESTGEFDPFATAIEQSRVNKQAALAAAVAAFLQGVGLLLP